MPANGCLDEPEVDVWFCIVCVCVWANAGGFLCGENCEPNENKRSFLTRDEGKRRVTGHVSVRHLVFRGLSDNANERNRTLSIVSGKTILVIFPKTLKVRLSKRS